MNTHPASRGDQANPLALLQSAPSPNRDGAGSFSSMLERNVSPEPAREPSPPPQEQHQRTDAPREATRDATREREPQRHSEPSRSERRGEDGKRAQGRESKGNDETAPAGMADRNAVPAEAEGEELPAGFAAISAILAAFDARPQPIRAHGEGLAAALAESEDGDIGEGNRGRHAGRLFLMGLGLSENDTDTTSQLKPGTVQLTNANSRGSFNAALAARAEATLTGFQTAAQGEAPLPGTALTGNLVAAQRAESTPLPQLQVTTPAGQRVWAEDVGNRMLWMIGRNESKAELVLTPPSLGKLGVSIQVNGDQTTAHFVAATQAAREALEQAMPRLREVLQQAGIQLGQTNVSTSDQQQAQDGGDTGRGGRGTKESAWGLDEDGTVRPPEPTRWSGTGNGMIDLFA